MNRFNIFFAFTLALFLFPPVSFSEQEEMEKIVVTGTKTWIDTERLGSTVTVINREEIERSGEVDITSILSRVPGLSVVSTGSRGGVTSIFARGGQSDYNLVMINGVQVNQAGGGFDISSVTTENIERIEIIKGAHSSLYGSDAASSVINIITKRGSGKIRKAGSVALGFRAEDAMILEHSSSISGSIEKLSYFISHQGIIDEGILEVNNDYKNNNFTANLNLEANDDLNISFFSIYRDSDFEFPTGSAGDRFDPVDPDQGTGEKSLVSGFDIVFSATEWWENTFKVGYTRLERENYDGPAEPEGSFGPYNSEILDKRMSLEYGSSFFADFDQLSTITSGGFEYEKESFTADPLDKSRKNYAFYTQTHFDLLRTLFVTTGIRYDDNESFGGKWSPSVFAKWKTGTTGTEIRGGVSRGIKEANFNENFNDFGGSTIPNPDLKPEETLTTEIGLRQPLFDNTVELDLYFFRNKFKNMIAYSFAVFENGTNYENISRTESKGAEASVSFYPNDSLILSAGYTYTEAEVTDDGGLGSAAFSQGEKLIRIPEHSFSFNAGYSKNALDLNLSGNYTGSRDDVNWSGFPGTRVKNDSFFVVDAAASYEITVKKFVDKIRLFSRVNNLFNTDYENVFGYSSPGFSMISGISVVR